MAENKVITRWVADTAEYTRKTKEAQKQLKEAGDAGKQASGALSALDKVLGTNVSSLTKMGLAVGAVSAALKIAKDAFMSSESNIDEWGRTTEGAKAAYETFLNTLNSGDWSGFFSKLQEAISGGRALYDLFDKLGSTKLNNEVLIATLEGKMAELRLMKQAGKDVQDEMDKVAQQLTGLKGENADAGKRANRRGWIDTVKNAGGDEGTAQAYWGKYKQMGQEFYNWAGNEIKRYKGMEEELTAEQQRRLKTLQAIVEKESTLQKYQSGYANSVREANAALSEQYKYNKWSGSGTSSGKSQSNGGETWSPISASASGVDFGWTESIKGIKGEMSRYNKMFEEAGSQAGRDYASGMIEALNTELGNLGNAQDAFKGMIPDLSKTLPTFETIAQEGKDISKSWGQAASIIGSVGSALNSIENPTAKVVGIIAETIATIASAYGQALASDQSTKSNIWAFLAASAASVISMAATINAVKSNAKYASGGEIKGTSFSGDNIGLSNAYVNAGEYVFNRAQLGNLAGQLQNGGLNNMKLEASVKAEQITIALANRNRRTGRGETVSIGG